MAKEDSDMTVELSEMGYQHLAFIAERENFTPLQLIEFLAPSSAQEDLQWTAEILVD